MLRAKTEAVLGGIAIVFAPFVVMLAATVPFAALVALVGIMIAAGSATAIQFWFRTQARRSLFRRRQTSSRIATYAEALSSIGWAGTGALAATGPGLRCSRGCRARHCWRRLDDQPGQAGRRVIGRGSACTAPNTLCRVIRLSLARSPLDRAKPG